MDATTKNAWWRGAVIYQIYPRSFADSNGDGVGDILGIVSKLDYLKSLEIDAVWISPFFPSPMKDFGYDVSDYCNIDPMFGTLNDFHKLVAEAHARNIKIIIDQVWSHTSDEHAWFKESRSSRDNPKADWYIWADAKPDGSPPNNWLSYFGGPAWQWDTRRCQYYLHHFLVSQPAVNLRNPQVLEAIEAVARFWFDRGVDGFRLDAAHTYLCDPKLSDNPARTAKDGPPNDVPLSNPLSMQMRVQSGNHPDTVTFLKKIRSIADSYTDRVLLAEVGGEDAEGDAVKLVQNGDRCHLAYSFSLFSKPLVLSDVRTLIKRVEDILGDGWLCWATSNHDVERVASRWHVARGITPQEGAKFALALGLSLRGSFCLYEGEELGLTEADIPFERMQDPFGIAFYPEFKGRDGCRTPMPWDDKLPNAGFSDGVMTWLPVSQEHIKLSVNVQQEDPDSVLNFARRLLAWRKGLEPLKTGDLTLLPTSDTGLAFTRHTADKKVLCVYNLGKDNLTVSLPADWKNPVLTPFHSKARLEGSGITLESWGFALLSEGNLL